MKILYWIPKNLVSFFAGKLMYLRFPRVISNLLITQFARLYQINLSEAEKSIDNYYSIGDFFTRKLKDGVRPLSPSLYVHPADSKMTSRGKIVNGHVIQAKGKNYSLSDFLDVTSIDNWENGYFITYYLCPTDYHRVHSPIDGVIKEVRYLPGQLWPVNDWSVSNIENLFVRNERVVVEIESAKGVVAVVFVGATNVGSILLSFEPELRTNHTHVRKSKKWSYSKNPISIQKGDELGMFCMGSTVIVVAPSNWQEELAPLTQNQIPVMVKVRSF